MSNKRVSLAYLIEYIDNVVRCDSGEGADDDIPSERDVSYDIISKENIRYIDEFKYDNIKINESIDINDFKKNCKKIFDPYIDNIIRNGTLKKCKDDYISLLYSVFSCIDENFCTKSKSTKVKWIYSAIDKMISDIKKENINYELKNTDISQELQKFSNNKIVLRFLSDYFNINIFLINVIEDRIFVVYGEPQFNIFKPTIFLSFYDDQFEYLSYKNKKIWAYDDPPFKKLIKVCTKKIDVMDIDDSKVFELGTEDLLKYLDQPPIQDTKNQDSVVNMINTIELETEDTIHANIDIDDEDDDDEEDSTDIFETKKSKSSPKISVNNKMKLKELQDLAVKYSISLFSGTTKTGKPKKKTKAMLVKELESL